MKKNDIGVVACVDVDDGYTTDDNGAGIFLLVVGACHCWDDGTDVENFCDSDGDDGNGGGYAVGGGA